jgi:hypothetical protein
MPHEATDPHDLSAPLERCPVCQRGGHTDDAHKRKIDPTSPPKALYAYAYDGGDVDSVWAKLCAHDASRFVHNDRWPSSVTWVLPPTKYVLAKELEARLDKLRAALLEIAVIAEEAGDTRYVDICENARWADDANAKVTP